MTWLNNITICIWIDCMKCKNDYRVRIRIIRIVQIFFSNNWKYYLVLHINNYQFFLIKYIINLFNLRSIIWYRNNNDKYLYKRSFSYFYIFEIFLWSKLYWCKLFLHIINKNRFIKISKCSYIQIYDSLSY